MSSIAYAQDPETRIPTFHLKFAKMRYRQMNALRRKFILSRLSFHEFVFFQNNQIVGLLWWYDDIIIIYYCYPGSDDFHLNRLL